MARNTKPGKTSEVTKKLVKEQEETAKRDEARHEEMIAEEAAKAKAAQEESDNQAPPIAVPDVPDKERKARYDALIKKYAEENPVKYAAKKARGEFDSIPANFYGGNELNMKG